MRLPQRIHRVFCTPTVSITNSHEQVVGKVCARCGRVERYDDQLKINFLIVPKEFTALGLQRDETIAAVGSATLPPLDPIELLLICAHCGEANSAMDSPENDETGGLRWECRSCYQHQLTPLDQILLQRIGASVSEAQLRDLLVNLSQELRDG